MCILYVCTHRLEHPLVDDGGLCEGEVVHMRDCAVQCSLLPPGGRVGRRGGWLKLLLPHGFAAEESAIPRRAHQSHWLRPDAIQRAVAREGRRQLPQRQRLDLMQHGQEGNWAHEYVIVDKHEPLEAVDQVGVEVPHGLLAATHRPEAEILPRTVTCV